MYLALWQQLLQSTTGEIKIKKETLHHKASHSRMQSSDDITFTASNVVGLRTASLVSETSEAEKTNTLLQKTQDFLASMPFWSLSQCMSLLKSFDNAPYHTDNASIIQQCVSLISSKTAMRSSLSTPMCYSPESRLSSNDSDELESYSSAGFFEDITHLSIHMVEKLILAMLSHHIDNKFLGKCLLHYLQAAKKRGSNSRGGHNAWIASELVSLEAFESVVSLLHKLSRVSVPCKSLFGLQRMALRLHASKGSRRKIEEMIGFQLDKATLDNILVSRRHNSGTLYDVNLVLRLVKLFLRKQADAHLVLDVGPVKRVGCLMDKYLTEIAPDPNLTGAQFRAVAECLPDFARDSHDDLYQALDMFLEAHPRTQEEESTELCKVIDFNKLSPETSKHAAQSLWFPARVTLKALLQEQATFKAAIGGYRHHHYHQHQQPHYQHPSKSGDIAVASLSSSSSSSKSTPTPTLQRLGSDVSSKPSSHCHQRKSSIDSTYRPFTAFKQHNDDNQHTNDVLNGESSPSSCSSFTWDYHSSHSQSNGSSRRSLYEQMAMEFPEVRGEQDELGYHLVLQQNEELRTDLEVMRHRVSELEKACGQMRSKVSNYTRPKRLLC
ncbi:hypothetical protein GOP47_0001992 [Adiantum capillus-veneris]|uniref:NPH3 domain-containing protein n=1 Tax=Adiantum capillus-veneris TaxID=13818 RepID=A0A9D4VA09_ADICA|nr:hypothetical protein GOP47_0001992 [Adiantum capillus-veneris]